MRVRNAFQVCLCNARGIGKVINFRTYLIGCCFCIIEFVDSGNVSTVDWSAYRQFLTRRTIDVRVVYSFCEITRRGSLDGDKCKEATISSISSINKFIIDDANLGGTTLSDIRQTQRLIRILDPTVRTYNVVSCPHHGNR